MIKGNFHTQGSAARKAATLLSNKSGYTVKTEDGRAYSGKVENLVISDRLGNVERKLTLQDGSVFTTGDNDAIDQLVKGAKRANSLVHALESNMGWVAIALISVILTFFAFVKWGIPWASTQIAHLLPQQVHELIGENSLKFVDDYILEESELSTPTKEAIRLHFSSTLIPLVDQGDQIRYKLHFRKWNSGDKGIPNALALPSGDIILTDTFVELCQNQDEMDGVILHEMGHIVHRHSLQRIIATTFVTTVVMMVTGDSSSIADLGFGIGSLLISSHYSRGHESEADVFAFEYMLRAKIDPKSFSDIIDRMTTYLAINEGNETAEKDDDTTPKSNSSLMNYISSHPRTTDRMELAKQYSSCFNNGLTTCSSALNK